MVPLQELIDMAINLIFKHNPNLNIAGKKLKNFSFLRYHRLLFFFNSKHYNQIDLVALGSPLAPVLANIFMRFYETKWLNEYNLNKSKLYLR